MRIDERIYNEMEVWDARDFLGDYDSDEFDDRYEILRNINLQDQYGVKDFDDLTDEEMDNFLMDSVLLVKEIDFNSLLYVGLYDWYGSFDRVVEGVRSGTVYDGKLYFGTGIGYDTIGADLLGCNCDGVAREEFINFCNESRDVTELGGYAYLKNKGLETHKLQPTRAYLKQQEQSQEVGKNRGESLKDRAEKVERAVDKQQTKDKSVDREER